MTHEQRRQRDWSALYTSLVKALAPFGDENAFGDGDYWVVDDDWGDESQKICVSHEPFITPALIAAIQDTLEKLPNWRIVVQVDKASDGSRALFGLTVRRDRVERDLLDEAPD